MTPEHLRATRDAIRFKRSRFIWPTAVRSNTASRLPVDDAGRPNRNRITDTIQWASSMFA